MKTEQKLQEKVKENIATTLGKRRKMSNNTKKQED